MTPDRKDWIRRWLNGWKEQLEQMDTRVESDELVPPIALEVAVSMGLELLEEVR